jgi:beta-lactamase regulating signal transducer with metallopeptidase domain
MIDLSVKFAAVAATAWLITRHVRPADAAAAHRLWLAVLAAPALWLLGSAIWPPLAYVVPRAGHWPAIVTHPSAEVWNTAVVVYAAGAAVLLARAAGGVVAVQRLLRGSRPVYGSDLGRLRRLAGSDRLDIREADLDVPVTAGFVRPSVVLPQEWRGMTDGALTAILRHEAAHVRRHDCAIALLCAVIEAALWFHPAVWLAAFRVRRLAEIACDAEAAGSMDGRQYASELLALAARWTRRRRPPYAMTAGAGTSIATRLRLLLDELERGRRRRRVLIPVATVALPVVLLTSGAIHFGQRGAPVTGIARHDSHRDTHDNRHQMLRSE